LSETALVWFELFSVFALDDSRLSSFGRYQSTQNKEKIGLN
jgi:hypothetical protein